MACSAWLRSAGTGLTGAAGGSVGRVAAGAALMGGGVAAGGATAAGAGVGRPGPGVAASVWPAPGEGRADASPVEGRTTVTSSSITAGGVTATGEDARGEAWATWPPISGGFGRRPRTHHAMAAAARTATAMTTR